MAGGSALLAAGIAIAGVVGLSRVYLRALRGRGHAQQADLPSSLQDRPRRALRPDPGIPGSRLSRLHGLRDRVSLGGELADGVGEAADHAMLLRAAMRHRLVGADR